MENKRTILVADDQLINRKILERFLRQDYHIVVATDGRETMRLLRENGEQIAAVLLDIVMPKMDGYAVLREMSEDFLLATIPVIVTTQREGDEAELKALSLGAADFISKPYKPDIIRQRLRNLIALRETRTLAEIVGRDALTGIYNKDSFYQRVAQRLAEDLETEYDIIATDLEHFKLVNDTYGVEEGDRLLRFIGQTLARLSEERNGICAHMTADQFMLLCPRTETYAPQLLRELQAAFQSYPLDIQLVVKLGIYPVENRRLPVMTMYDRAILAAQTIKGCYGRDYTYYDEKIRTHLLRERQMTDHMQIALKEEQFQVYLQPKYDLITEKIAGAEALVRWIHPVLGFLPPDEFIPLFEKNGFITELDQYVWDKTCAIIASWIREDRRYVPVSVNVSRKDIYNADLPQVLLHLVQKHGLKPKHLHLEITESAYTENQEQLVRVVAELKGLGFQIEMDDFGSGYSSLNMLSELPIDILKLDMKFIQNESEQDSSRNILSFIISLAKWMNLLVVAEGVETEEQVELLRNMDCNYVQGYYYARPMPNAAFTALLRQSDIILRSAEELLEMNKGRIQVREKKSEKAMLIVDDTKLNRAILGEIFAPVYTVVEADNGAVAYAYIKEHAEEIAIILLDLVMPVMDGFQLLERLKGDEMLRSIPVIITSQAGERNEARALELGASDFIFKPYNMEVALRRVRNVLADSKAQSLEREKELIMRMREMERTAKTDPLTGLSNRADLESRMTEFFALRKSEPALFLMLDIDNFKLVNDTLGHVRGDETIQQVADILRSRFRPDDVICRMGGDEFGVFITGPFSKEELNRRLARLCQALQFSVGDRRISCSIGACLSPNFGRDYQTLYQNADIALMTAKRLGKNQYQIFGGETELPSHVLFRNMDWLLDEASDAVMVCDARSFEVLYLNNIACQIAKKNKKECIGKHCYEALWNLDEPCAHCVHISHLTKDYCEHEANAPDGGRTYLIKGKLIDWGGIPARIQYIQDSTEKVKFGAALNSLNHCLRTALERKETAFLRCAVDDSWTILEANSAFYEMSGYTAGELETRFGNRLIALIAPEYVESNTAEVKRRFQVWDSVCIPSALQKADGSKVAVKVCGIRIPERSGNEYCYFTCSAIENG